MSNRSIAFSNVEVLAITILAVLIDHENTKAWIPRSQMLDSDRFEEFEVGDNFDLLIPEWLAIEKELI